MIGERIRTLRKEAGLTQRELAELIDMSYSSIQAYEYNKKRPSVPVLCELAELFQVSTDYILGLKDEAC